MKKLIKLKIIIPLVSLVVLVLIGVATIAGVLGAVSGSSSNSSCNTTTTTTTASEDSSVSSGEGSIDSFVKAHEEAYIKSWGVGGFLPSASIAQTMAETSFSMSVPSFAEAHNMGGVKWTSADTYPKTIAFYGSDSVSGSGSGTSVGDNTGGGYTWFKDFDAGIVGKAEFMSRQTLYSAAINNTDGISTLNAIADGGWATDPNYKVTLANLYNTLGSQYKWLDDKAIAEYGTSPVDTLSDDTANISSSSSSSASAEEEDECEEEDSSSSSAADGTGSVPSDATAWGYTPDQLPESLKAYIIDPAQLGLAYDGSTGWVEQSGQCVDLTESLGNLIWGTSGITQGNGVDQASAWATKFGNSVKSDPKAGAIFSSGISQPGHTGIVCHVFQDGSILIVEQNTPFSGIDYFGKKNTWNFRIVSPSTQTSDHFVYAYSGSQEPKLN
ncbi:glucosaminidase domain-containing protein [Streptococcus equinus]|uniref:Flagellum-specific peptidoglycan hydrolase FlgJ n=1 Tax=Streptococcus equinus TaxID=1335 RepID=A0A1G9MP75_STREI|nr:glucosaminidase domain-containing protein [Streptococcus equinus]SDL76068.1 Flagellum-specific peptidoglycan hydrolase FlgJ [Streptococcus equinus]